MGEKLFKKPIKYTSEIRNLIAEDCYMHPQNSLTAKNICNKMLLKCSLNTITSGEISLNYMLHMHPGVSLNATE